jgi:hypothetical protein
MDKKKKRAVPTVLKVTWIEFKNAYVPVLTQLNFHVCCVLGLWNYLAFHHQNFIVTQMVSAKLYDGINRRYCKEIQLITLHQILKMKAQPKLNTVFFFFFILSFFVHW